MKKLDHETMTCAALTVALAFALLAFPAGNAGTSHIGVSTTSADTSQALPTALPDVSQANVALPGIAGFQPRQTDKTTQINTTVGPAADLANVPLKFEKDDGNYLWLNATVMNPLAVSATVTYPTGNVSQVTDITTDVNGLVTLRFTLPVDAPSGTYTLFITVTKGPLTSNTQFSVTESGQQSLPLPGVNFSP